MTEKDINVLTQLINECGIIEVEKVVQLNKEIITYIYNTRFKETINAEQPSFVYNENNNCQMFTNEKTSVFCINEKIVNLNLLVANKDIKLSKSVFVEPIEMQKYFDKSKQLFGNNFQQVRSIHADKFILSNNCNTETISINEYKIIKLLLKNPKIYASLKNSIIYAEGENGYAYVLGKKDNKQLRF